MFLAKYSTCIRKILAIINMLITASWFFCILYDEGNYTYMSMQPTNRLCLCRYNDFQHDPLAKCNCTPPYSGENGISARSDLNPANGTYPFSALGHRSHGGTDNKVRTGVRRLACILYYRTSTHKERSCC